MSKKMISACLQDAQAKHRKMIEIKIKVDRIRELKRENFKMVLKDVLMLPYRWCEENTVGKWDRGSLIIYYFEDDTDAMAFKLMWL